MRQLDLSEYEKRQVSGRGGRRDGAGRPKLTAAARKKRGPRPEPHSARARLRAYEPQHVVLRSNYALSTFRSDDVLDAIGEAAFAVSKHEDTFRIVHFSLQDSHIHLIVEASDNVAMARGMKSFAGAVSKHINALITRLTGERRRGSVFRDRYFVIALRTPRQVRNTIAYVLNNWRHHGADRGSRARIDKYSSAITFDYWKERDGGPRFQTPSGYFYPMTAWPRTYLLKELWHRKYPRISIYEVPGGSE
ncbi:MAG: transposase [Kofleriaceae bacterium]